MRQQRRLFHTLAMALALIVLASAAGTEERRRNRRSTGAVARRAIIVPAAAASTTNLAILEGGSRGFVSLSLEARALPFTKEVSDGANMHNSTRPTCVVVPASGTYRVLGSVQFSLDEFGERSLKLTATAPGGAARDISFPVTAAPNQSFVTFLSVSSVTSLSGGDCVELVADAQGHGSPSGLFALAVGFALWQN